MGFSMLRVALAAGFPAAVLAAVPALAEDRAPSPVDLSVAYTADAAVLLAGAGDRKLRVLDNLDLIAGVDLDGLVGWHGASAHVYVLNNMGARPNDAAGTLQGVNNIEVARPRLRLYEAWIEQQFAGDRASLRAGLYNLNSEFYATESSDLLIAPGFGIGTELAATGESGPSIFPMTALAARLEVKLGKAGYVRSAVLGAKAGSLDTKGVADFTFPRGVLFIAEGGYDGRARLSIGAWSYSEKVEDLLEVDAAGNPLHKHAQGAYVLAEVPLGGGEGGDRFKGFVRAGVSDGHTSPFHGGWQAGVHIADLFGKERGEAALGVSQAVLSHHYRDLLIADKIDAAGEETQFEGTVAYPVTEFFTIQPDLQLVLAPGGDRAKENVVVGTLRLSVAF
jgi:porin